MLIYLAALEDRDDQAAFLDFYRANERLVWHMTGRFFREEERRWDSFQETWTAAARNFSKILSLPCEKRAAYLVIIVKNQCRDLLAKERKYAPFPEEPEAAEALLGTEGPDLEEAAAVRADARRARELLSALPEHYQAVLECRLVLGLSNGETARRLGVSDAKVSVWYRRGRALLVKKLREEGIDYG